MGVSDEDYDVYDIFTPSTQARLNFVPRPELENRIADALRTPGRQIVVYGETGSGKSTLVERKLEELYSGHITTRCHGAMSFAQVLLDAFDQLEPFYAESRSAGSSNARVAALEADYGVIKATLNADAQRTDESTSKRALPPQLTPQRLGQLLGARELCWVVEDFHKVAESEKASMAQVLKVFCDLASSFRYVKIVALGATDTAREIIQYDAEMGQRVAEIHVPLMNNEEVFEILSGGECLLNVEFGETKSDVADYSMGVASICHQLGLNMCVQREIFSKASQRLSFDKSDLAYALQRYLEDTSDTFKSKFDLALRRERVRKFDNCRIILKILANGPADGMTHNEIFSEIRREHKDYPSSNLTIYLKELSSAKRGQIVHAAPDGRFRFVDAFHYLFAHLMINRPQGRTLDPKALSAASPIVNSIVLTMNSYLESDRFQTTWSRLASKIGDVGWTDSVGSWLAVEGAELDPGVRGAANSSGAEPKGDKTEESGPTG